MRSQDVVAITIVTIIIAFVPLIGVLLVIIVYLYRYIMMYLEFIPSIREFRKSTYTVIGK